MTRIEHLNKDFSHHFVFLPLVHMSAADEVCKSYQLLITSVKNNQKAIYHRYKAVQDNPYLSIEELESHYSDIQSEYKRIQKMADDIKKTLLRDTFMAILDLKSSEEARVHQVLCQLFRNVYGTLNLILEVKKTLLRMIQQQYKKPITKQWLMGVLKEAMKDEDSETEINIADGKQKDTQNEQGKDLKKVIEQQDKS